MISEKDLAFLGEAYAQAANAAGNSDPNPAVGAIITNGEGRVIARGFTQRAGFAHAERHALEQLKGMDLTQSTMYVTLEPCCHHGRTAPCSDAILEHRIRRVVIGERDFAPEVQGRSVELLRNAGVSVTLADEGSFQTQRWLTTGPFFFTRKMNRPRVLLKWAQTADGRIGPTTGASGAISGSDAAFLTAMLRFWCKMTVAAPGTVLNDNPRLNVRPLPLPDNLHASGLSAFMGDFLRQQWQLAEELQGNQWNTSQIRPPERLLLLPDTTEARLQTIREAQARIGGTWHSMAIGRAEWSLDFEATFRKLLADILGRGFNSTLIEAGPAFSEKVIEHGFADAIAVYRSRTKTAYDLWGEQGRGNSISTQLTESKLPLAVKGYSILETARFADDDFLLLVRNE